MAPLKKFVLGFCGFLVFFQCQAQALVGIPEPGLLVFGSLTNVSGGPPIVTGVLTWQILGGSPSESVSLPATLVAVNGQFFHFTRIPFETRSVGPIQFGATPNILGLTSNSTTYVRSAFIGTNPCVILNPSQANFAFSKLDRGRSDRVDLSISIATPNFDSDGDGMPDWAELIAGTDPHDPNSVLKLSADVRPSPQGGIVIQWSSVPEKVYSVFATTNLSTPFFARATNILATTNITTYRDPTALGPGPFFYRIKVNQN